MQRFAQLYTELDASTATRDKVASLTRYWSDASPDDAAWAVYFLAGGRPRRAITTTALREWAADAAGIDAWLFEVCYQAVGDLAETIAHLLPAAAAGDDADATALPLHRWLHDRLLPLRGQPLEAQQVALRAWMAPLDWSQRFVLIKLIGGGWRVGVSKQLVIRSLAEHAGLPATVVAQRLMGYTDARHAPDADAYARLIAPLDGDAEQPAVVAEQPEEGVRRATAGQHGLPPEELHEVVDPQRDRDAQGERGAHAWRGQRGGGGSRGEGGGHGQLTGRVKAS